MPDKIIIPPSPEQLKIHEGHLDEVQRILITYGMTHRLKPNDALAIMSMLTAQLGEAMQHGGIGMKYSGDMEVVRNRAIRIMKIAGNVQ